MNRPLVLMVSVLVFSIGMSRVALPKPAPEIFSLTPDHGPAGQEIELKGTGLTDTRHVYFCIGRTVREAKFKVIDAQELRVIAPPFFRPAAAATIVVETYHGVTVGMPASVLNVDGIVTRSAGATSFVHVLKNGVFTSSAGTVFVDEAGTAEAPGSAGLCFVKKGGTLLKADHFLGLIFHEPHGQLALLRNKPHPQMRVVAAQEITASIGIEPFLYERPEEPAGSANSPPKVLFASPSHLQPGAILTLKGSGFLETSDVHVIYSTANNASTAAFRVLADNQLEVELPDNVVGNPLIVVVNPKGATVVLSPMQLARDRHHFRANVATVQVVGAGMIMSDGGGSRNYLIEKGGVVTRTGGSCTFFVMNGGRMAFSGSGGLTVFCANENDIDKTQHGGGGNKIIEVGSLSMSMIHTPIEIASPYRN